MSPTLVPPNIVISEHVSAHIAKKASLSLGLFPNFMSKNSQGVRPCIHGVSSGYSSLSPGELELRYVLLRLVDTMITAPSPLLRNQ